MASVATDAWCSLRIRVLGQHVGRSESQSKQGETRTFTYGLTNQGSVGRRHCPCSARPDVYYIIEVFFLRGFNNCFSMSPKSWARALV